MDDLLGEFLIETNESLSELDLALVKLERAPGDQATLSLIFRMVHTIKGTCGFLGLPRLERVAHAGENVLGRVRDGELAATPAVVSAVLQGLDRIKTILGGLTATGKEPEGDDNALFEALERAASGDTAEAAAMPTAPEEPAPPADTGPLVGPQTIRVAVDVLEELMTLVGELVLTRNQLLQLSRVEGTTSFSVPLQRLSHITSDLQEGVMRTRMQPIGNAWNKLPRLVRDLALETGKKIALDMQGQATELDRQVLELMRDPLTHMVRNSADHGLETPEIRRAAGKPETGRIRLNAFHEGGHILIEVADDGRGLDLDRIRAQVLSRGLATEPDLAAMTESQIRSFIFRAGFSTASAVTAISGRGVGMDVVRSNIERIGGTIELTSTLGAGTCFTIKIPLTLAIVSALIVRAAGERFAIPQISVMELVRVGRPGRTGCDGRVGGDVCLGSDGREATAGTAMTIEHIGGTPVLRLRDLLLPLVSLGDLMRLTDCDTTPAATTPAATATVVVTAVGSGLLGIVVDEVYDTEEIVVKPVAPILRHVTMFSGNTILGDGAVVMILDPNGVARGAGVTAYGNARASAAAVSTTARSSDSMELLLFCAGGDRARHAVPLSLVARLEDIPHARIERAGDGYVTQYRGKLMPLIAMDGGAIADRTTYPVLVFADGERTMGLVVDAIVDVVHDRLNIELGSERPGLLGTAIVAGQAADVLDTGHWLMQAWKDWFGGAQATAATRPRVLVVEDSDFFRQLLVPTLAASGYDVTAAGSATEALSLREQGLMVDAIVSDIDMPEMDGLAFARRVREGGAWAALPLIALTGRDTPADAARGRAAGFTDYCQKFRRDALLASLATCLVEHELS